jgi:hypothetical protein
MIPITFTQVLLPFIQLMYELGTRSQTFILNKTFTDTVTSFDKVVEKFYEGLRTKTLSSTIEGEFCAEVVQEEMNRLVSITHRAMKIIEPPRKIEARKSKTSSVHPWGFAKFKPLKAPGNPPKHRNDCFHIKDIGIVPSFDEILSGEDPELPGNYQDVPEAHWLEPGPLRLLDTHFRLLREDFARPVRENINGFLKFLKQKNKKFSYRSNHLKTVVPLYNTSEQVGETTQTTNLEVNLHVYPNLRLDEFVIHRREGVCVRVRFSPPIIKESDQGKKSKQEFWKHTKRLGPGGLVALLFQKSYREDHFCVVFGVVVERDPRKMSMDNNCSILIGFAQTGSIHHDLVQSYMERDKINIVPNNSGNFFKSKNFLIEPTSMLFEAYRPVLKRLQNVS